MRAMLLVLACLSVGCAVHKGMVRDRVAELSGCPQPELHVDGAGTEYITQGCGSTFVCHVRTGGPGAYVPISSVGWVPINSQWADCNQIDGVREMVTTDDEVSRELQLKADCPPIGISILTRSPWSQKGERSYRVNTCGRPYLCTTSPGHHVDCALDTVETLP